MSMKDACVRFDDDLSAFLDGELGRKAATAMAAHLAGCERCRAEVRSAVGAWDVFQGSRKAQPLPKELRDNPYERRAPMPAPGLGWGYAAALAALCAALYLGLQVRRGPEPAIAERRRPVLLDQIDTGRQDVGLNPAPYLGHIPT